MAFNTRAISCWNLWRRTKQLYSSSWRTRSYHIGREVPYTYDVFGLLIKNSRILEIFLVVRLGLTLGFDSRFCWFCLGYARFRLTLIFFVFTCISNLHEKAGNACFRTFLQRFVQPLRITSYVAQEVQKYQPPATRCCCYVRYVVRLLAGFGTCLCAASSIIKWV